MSFLGWMALVGAVLLFMALTSAYIRRLPITTSAIYLALGLSISPLALNLVAVDFIAYKSWFEHLTETAVIISLFIGGLKLRLPLKNPAWIAAYRLAAPVMLGSIAGVAVFAHSVFGFDWGVSFLLGAALAPTDPVLASSVSVNDAADEDRTRYGLSGEAGFNDGAAFPFVVFALLWMKHNGPGEWLGEWALHRLVWAIPAGLLLGYLLGKGVGRLAIWLRSRHLETEAPNDFLALALIALSYVGAETIYAWGFLATFAAGLGFRHAEIKIVRENPAPEHQDHLDSVRSGDPSEHPPAEELVGKNVSEEDLKEPSKAAGVVVSEIISFGATAERLLEVMLVILVGVCLAIHWDRRAVPLALALFFVIRPLATLVFLVRTPTGRKQRFLMGWFGIRGIGSLYYLSYALNHGLEKNASEAVGITLSVVALSILIHGVSTQPIINWYKRDVDSAADRKSREIPPADGTDSEKSVKEI
ncbi:MAG TPA: sodium:proton antiporter [Pyrinomonadaceae bacterium]|jgi:NhaP-type Na+/H+ or K+/H+ antiporter